MIASLGKHRSALLTFVWFLGVSAAHAQGIVIRENVYGESLEGNLLGEPSAPFVSVYLPPGYTSDEDRRYPVVYFLHGYYGTDLSYFGDGEDGRDIPLIANRLFDSGASQEMIIVTPNCDNAYRGCMYSNSATSGYWETYIAEDLVTYIDSNHRTIASRESRGLAGHSMGGYGTLKIGMKRADVFSAIYALSSCCLNEFSPQGGDQARRIESVSPNDVPFSAIGTFARAAAWAPNPMQPPFYFDMPTVDGVVRPRVAARWAANSPIALLPSYVPQLMSLTAIKLDVGEQDGLISSNRDFSEAMRVFGIDHGFATYEGDHSSGVAGRLENHVLPFFSENLRGENEPGRTRY